MEYLAKCDGRISESKFLKISSDILNLGGAMLSDTVANSSNASINPIKGSSILMPYDILFNLENDFSNPQIKKRYSDFLKAEILIPHPINPRYILNL